MRMSDTANELQEYLMGAIPLVTSMGVSVQSADRERVILSAPLAPNTNHQSTAFGGSVAGLATLACWGWLWTVLREYGIQGRLVVSRSEIDYLKPVTTDFISTCAAPGANGTEAFLRTLERRGRARLTLVASVEDAHGVLCAAFTGEFVASRAE
jgi:thioesterase domain-containing protein